MASYYYLLSSLPMLKADGEMPFSYATFLDMCKSAVRDATYEMLENLTLSSTQGPLISEWSKFYTVFEQELINQRHLRLGRAVQSSDQKDETMAKAIAAVIHGKNPLEAEKALLAWEFQTIDELIGTHYFDDAALMGYALKLKLLERKHMFDQARGKKELHRIVNALEQHIMTAKQE